MMAMRTNCFILALALSIAQIAFLGSMIVGRANILRAGTDVRLTVEPVDPRDLLRGDYVTLGYQISRIDRGLLTEPAEGNTKNRWIYVRLAKAEDGSFAPVAARLDTPVAAELADNEVDLRGIVQQDTDEAIPVVYGIERFYVPEGEGRAIETAMRQDLFQIVAAIAADGTPQIKALLHDGRPVYREPLY